jgi:hypothetical protein
MNLSMAIRWRRIVTLVVLGILGGTALSFLVVARNAGLAPARKQLDRSWIAVQELTAAVHAPIAALLDKGLSEDDYAVFRTVIDLHLNNRSDARIAVGRTTEWPPSEQLPLGRLLKYLSSEDPNPLFDSAAIRDFVIKNRQSHSLNRDSLGRQAILVGRRYVEVVTNGLQDWSEFSSTNQGATGFLSLSRPGYDSSKRRALVYVSLQCGGLCGHGVYLGLERHGRLWSVVSWYEAWVG